jgi:processive 1,2-diacylglycerol beta-glucosyltransferase
VIISASIGSGHDAAAGELADRLLDAGFDVDRIDFLDLLPWRLGAGLRALYRRQLALAPASWQWLLAALARVDVLGACVVRLCRVAPRSARRVLHGDVDLVVCTYPLASQLLGLLKRGGRISAPVLTYLTDPAVHPLWLADGVELYLASHPATLRQLKHWRGAPIVLVAPAVGPGFRPGHDPEERQRARRAFGLPDGPLALVASGSWAVGQIEQAALEVAASGVATPVVVCGDNTVLRARLRGLSPGVVLGWVTDMPALMRAVDVAVLNSGGMTWAEAHSVRLPVLHYRPLPGHGRANAALLHEARQVPWVRRPTDLPAALRDTLAAAPHASPTDPRAPRPDPAELIAAFHTGWRPAISPGRVFGGAAPRARARRRRLTAAAGIGLLAGLTWLGTAVSSLPIAHRFDAVPAGQGRRPSLVIDLDPHQRFTDADLAALRHSPAVVSITKATLDQNPRTVARLAEASTPMVNGAAGTSHETAVIAALTARHPRYSALAEASA